MSIYPGNITDNEIGEGVIVYPGIGVVRRLQGAARITTTPATFWPVFVRSKKLGQADVRMQLPVGLVQVIGCAWGFYSRNYNPSQFVNRGTELIGTNTNCLVVATDTEATALINNVASMLGGAKINFDPDTFITDASVNVTQANYCNPFLGGSTANPVVQTNLGANAFVNVYNLTSTNTLGTPGAGVVYNPQTPGFGQDPGYYDLPVVVDVLMPWSIISVGNPTDAYDLSTGGIPF